jgi:hypothetical protein
MMKLQLKAVGFPYWYCPGSCFLPKCGGSISDNTTANNSVYNVQVNLAGIESEEETPVFQASAGKTGVPQVLNRQKFRLVMTAL